MVGTLWVDEMEGRVNTIAGTSVGEPCGLLAKEGGVFGTVETNGGGDRSEEDEEDETPDGDAGIYSGVDLVVNGSGVSVDKYGGNNVGDSEGCCESDMIESGIMPLDLVNNIQELYNEISHH